MLVACPALSALVGIRHGFFTRNGGVSGGLYASLNCGYGSGDAPELVAENRARAAGELGMAPQSLANIYQVHSATALIVGQPWPWQDAPQADALATNRPGIALSILTADCLPILFADAGNRVIACAHAGWKGALYGVIEATLARMAELGANPADTVATIGPAIAQGSYEVGAEFRDRFIEQAPENQIYFIHGARDHHFLFDLKSYAKERLKSAGVAHINMLAHDTCLEENDFFSYRRACLRGEPSYGRQITAIALEELP